MSTLSPPPGKKKKSNKGNRHVYITERIRVRPTARGSIGWGLHLTKFASSFSLVYYQYLKFEVPSIDTVIEEDKLTKKLASAREHGDRKAEAQALLQLGQLMKWKGKLELGDDFLAQSAVVLRGHTFADDHAQEEEDGA